ncbi:hypothetical protein CcaverHIS002_0504750 [Cutaneotrichosporon cavernicola]|uniref:Alpha/beta-hydrolase n=1 Tax=Cutaneotrichosporon cavernicola TaxID=279322 RepID=A0AA48L6F3_9TREE|nr:uncharacterized protein CcaverHIS019_0505290 [Cutaneotrichosporon cavernicola]BEI85074.1 hypothetical protein CcaverHIS002_0504750 [Cutaneotrichosporon cavernicola]BEI92901.1 hypothetical protein CcaverHIS019_0505290 [Cutaneotrichosporon cavernicola]BEJ00677.1 hypothetical protein CcaverHIS631_0505340 [Cutaneotrichosporon cavernicola]BEJ08443.1 hypothetical protein CcaverHIS641_0505370 [Cutaneotrichosporon cavernicola]
MAWQAPWQALRPALRPAAALLATRSLVAGFSTSTTALNNTVQTTCTRWVVRPASPSASRECPTPLVLVRTPGLSYPAANPCTQETWKVWADMFALRGYTTVEVDVSVTTGHQGLVDEAVTTGHEGLAEKEAKDIGGPVKQAADALDGQLRRLGIPFAPVIVASGPACLVAQAYVSDYRASGLVLIEPPPDQDPRVQVATSGAKAAGGEASKAFAWPRFRFEPHFPILVMSPPQAEGDVRASRLGQEALEEPGGRGVSVMVEKDGPRGEETRMDVERWLDWSGY